MRKLLLLACLLSSAAIAGESDYKLVIRDHRFQPAEITIPAGKKVRLIIDNQDATPEEFDSYELNREKVIPGKSQVTLFIGPLKPGRYSFVGEFNADTAMGVIVAE